MYAVAPLATPANALEPTVVGALPRNSTVESEESPSNAKSPIDVTVSGIVMEVKAVASLNAESPIVDN
jgi:hypothetical protein